jgi:uncharacterized SAM-binding protein YcdF (DUF218 family)
MQNRAPKVIIWSLVALVGLAAIWGCWLRRAALLGGAANAWVVSDALTNADAIAVLGGGVNTRPFAAADLYKTGYAKLILITIARPSRVEDLGIVPSNAELARSVLIKLGVPPQIIIDVGHNVSNTYEEAGALREWAQANGAKKIIVITEKFSSRRVQWIFDREFATGQAKVMIYTVPESDYDFDRWWQDERGIIQFQNEALKYIYYRLKY